MLLRNLTKVYISEYEVISDHGEKSKKWKYKDTAYVNMQQDVNQLDKNNAGIVDYEIYKCRSDRYFNVEKGNGISLTDISKATNFIPEYLVLDSNKIGQAFMFRMEKNNAN